MDAYAQQRGELETLDLCVCAFQYLPIPKSQFSFERVSHPKFEKMHRENVGNFMHLELSWLMMDHLSKARVYFK